MTNPILLTPFNDDTGEITATAKLWGKEADIFVDGDDFDDELPNQSHLDKIITYLEWLNANQKLVIDFALDAEDFLNAFNDWVEEEINQKGKAKLYDNTILTKTITYDDIYQSIAISSVFINGYDDICLSVDLIATPDYFGGHTFTVEIDSDFTMMFGGVNG